MARIWPVNYCGAKNAARTHPLHWLGPVEPDFFLGWSGGPCSVIIYAIYNGFS
jgi:hypothetical protein